MAARRERFDPRSILAPLERNYVNYVLIGGLARVLRGANEITGDVDICPSFATDNIGRLLHAIVELQAVRVDGGSATISEKALEHEPVISLSTRSGPLKIVGVPAGAPNGYVDLRRAATTEHLGAGLQPLVASTGDLARMASALHRDHDLKRLPQLRRIMELEADREQTLREPAEVTRRPSRMPTPSSVRRLSR